VRLAISGSIQRLPSMLRLTLNLVDARQLVQIGSRTIDIATGREVLTQDTVISAATALLALELEPRAQRALAAGGTTAPAAYELFVKGRGYLQRFDRGAENIDLAIDSLSRAVGVDPQYALAHSALGEAYWRKYDATKQTVWIDRAVEQCENALTIDSRLAPVHVTLSMVARGRGRYEEAVAVASRAVELDSVSSEAYRELGRAQEALNRFADAEQTYRKAIEARPDDWQVYNTLGSFFLGRGRLPEAEASYQKVIELTPDNTRGYNNLGVVYWRWKREDDAARAWERSISIRVSGTATSNLGAYYFAHARFDDSALAFERAVAISPNDWRMWRNFAAALQQVPAQRHRAREAYQKAANLAESERKINPRQAGLLAGLADAYSMLGSRDEALDALSAAERLEPDPENMFTMATAYEQLGDRSHALHWLGKALQAGYAAEKLEKSPSLTALREDKRYRTLVRQSLTH
jgi:tetratricopeptide (TPR) repeat protein